MTAVAIPFQVLADFDPNDLPPGPQGPAGPAGAGIVAQSDTDRLAAGATTASTSWAHTGHSVTITPGAATNKIHLRASGRVGHDGAGTIVYFTWFKNGSPDVDLTPIGFSFMDAARILDSGDAVRFDTGTLIDAPGVTAPVTYKLMWKVTNATAYFGKRYGDALMDVGGVIDWKETIA